MKRAVEERVREWQMLLEEARAYAGRIRKALPDAEVFLFGSAARGDFNLGSDLDLLVVALRYLESALRL
jgi:predicted nucleotidyltransferase